MATPDFVLELRRHIGTAPLPLVGVTAVVFRDEKVLLGRRADNGRLACVSGIVDPGEQPADAAVRECLEEAGVNVRATRLALVRTAPPHHLPERRSGGLPRSGVPVRMGVGRAASGRRRAHRGLVARARVSWATPPREDVRKIALALAEDDPAVFDGGRPR